MNPPISVPYINVRQENKYWCWAAVASNVYNSLFPSAPLSQCQVAVASGQDCRLPNAFSLANALNGSPTGPGLHIFENKSSKAVKFFAFIQDELSGVNDGQREPVTAEVDFATVVHFVAITALDPATNHVWVADPFPGGDPVEFDFDSFLHRYYFMDDQGEVQQSNGLVQALHAVNVGSSSPSPPAPKCDENQLPDFEEKNEITKTCPDALHNFSSFNSAPADLQRILLNSAQDRSQARQVFTLGLADLLEGGKGLEDAHFGGWRLAARSGDEVIAADMYARETERGNRYPNDAADPPTLACVRRGGEILQMLNAIQQLSEPPLSDHLPTQPYDIHLLLLPGLVTDALWLQPKDSNEKVSYVIPFNTLIETFNTERVCTDVRFLEIVRPIAEHWKKYIERGAYAPSDPER